MHLVRYRVYGVVRDAPRSRHPAYGQGMTTATPSRRALLAGVTAAPLVTAAVPSSAASLRYRYDRHWDFLSRTSVIDLSGVAVGPDGSVWACGGTRYVRRFSPSGTLRSSFAVSRSPYAVSVDPKGYVHVAHHSSYADRRSGEVVVYSPGGQRIRSYRAPIPGPGFYDFNPADIAIDAKGYCWTVDASAHVVSRFSPGGRHLSTWGGYGSGADQLNSPAGVAIGRYGTIYVADTGNHRVQHISSTGRFVRRIGLPGTSRGRLTRPHSVAVSPRGRLIVADGNRSTGNGARLQEFSLTGSYVATVGESVLNQCSGVAADSQNRVFAAGRNESLRRGIDRFVLS